MTKGLIYSDQVGIVIIGRNEGERLIRCINSVLLTKLPFVYVDSHSTDGSIEFAKSTNINLLELGKEKKINASVARNAGFNWLMDKYPELSYVHFIDGDCELDENWIENAVKSFLKDEDIAVVCGRLREREVYKSVFTLLSDMSWYIKPGNINACGGIATIKSETYCIHGGFDESLIAGADPEFHSRVRKTGKRIICLDAPMGTHDCAMDSLKQWNVRNIKTGFGYADLSDRNGKIRPLFSIFLWALVIPALIVMALFLFPIISLALVVLYPIQVFRITKNLDIPYKIKDKFIYSVFCLYSKFPQLIGVFRYFYKKISKEQNTIIEYKKDS